MQRTHERHRRISWRLLLAIAALVSLTLMPVAGQTTNSQATKNQESKSQAGPTPKTPPAKSPADNLPDLPANLAAKLKPIGNGRVFAVAAPRSSAVPLRSVRPPVRQPSGGTIARLSCIHNTNLFVTAEYPVLLCHPAIDDIRATNAGNISARTAPAPAPTPASTSTSKLARAATRLEPQAALSYRVRSSAWGLMVCSYARMPVVATLQKRNISCENPNAFAYSIDIAGVGLFWTGDPEMRPTDLRYFDEPSCVSDVATSCSGASACTPLCGAGANPTATPAPPPPLQ